MKRARKLIAALLALAVVASVIAVTTSVSAAEVKKTKTSAGKIRPSKTSKFLAFCSYAKGQTLL